MMDNTCTGGTNFYTEKLRKERSVLWEINEGKTMNKRKTILKEAGVLLIATILVSTTLCVFTPMAMADKPSGNGYDANGFNWKARVWYGWLPGYESISTMTIKWSKDWQWDMTTVTSDIMDLVPDDTHTAVGAYVIYNILSYLTSSYGLIPWDGMVAPAGAYYKVIETYKVMKVSDNLAAWNDYLSHPNTLGAWSFFYGDGVAKYIYIQWHVDRYHEGTLVFSADYTNVPPYGLGQPLW